MHPWIFWHIKLHWLHCHANKDKNIIFVESSSVTFGLRFRSLFWVWGGQSRLQRVIFSDVVIFHVNDWKSLLYMCRKTRALQFPNSLVWCLGTGSSDSSLSRTTTVLWHMCWVTKISRNFLDRIFFQQEREKRRPQPRSDTSTFTFGTLKHCVYSTAICSVVFLEQWIWKLIEAISDWGAPFWHLRDVSAKFSQLMEATFNKK